MMLKLAILLLIGSAPAASQAGSTASVPSQKTISIELDKPTFDNMKNFGYKLCFAKKVGHAYNVVWSAKEDYLQSTDFSWTSHYSVFATMPAACQVGMVVKSHSHSEPIDLGQQVLMNQQGSLESAVTQSSHPNSLLFESKFETPIHNGVNYVPPGGGPPQPIYVSPTPIVPGVDVLTPVEKVYVWFEKNIQTSSMFSDARSRGIEIDMTHAATTTFTYNSKGEWMKTA